MVSDSRSSLACDGAKTSELWPDHPSDVSPLSGDLASLHRPVSAASGTCDCWQR